MKKDFEFKELAQENTVGLDLQVWYCHVEDAIYSVFLLDSCKAKNETVFRKNILFRWQSPICITFNMSIHFIWTCAGVSMIFRC